MLVLRLFVAEKPSLGRAIAEALGGSHKACHGYIEISNGDCVSWCIGHLLEQASPDDYDKSLKQWRRESLPIIPEHWKLKPKAQTKKQLSVLKKLVKQADIIIHAGDPDREGQLLVDQLLDYLKISQKQKQTALRCLISDLNTQAVKKALASMRANRDFQSLSISGLARARADWLYGMNLTRAFTLSGQKSGFRGVLSVGRVQTPLLALVVRRDVEIESFQPHPFYEVYACITQNDSNLPFIFAKWQPSEACIPFQDDQSRVLSKPLACNVITRIKGQPATVTDAKTVQKKHIPPLPYNLSSLQIDAAKRFGYTAKQVLDICQTLYERHKLITYPRSDCRYLPEEHFLQAKGVMIAIAKHSSELQPFTEKADINLKSRAWNNKKTGAHHAIIPTLKAYASGLTEQEVKVYTLIARQYLAQFFPDYITQEQSLTFDIVGGCFVAKASKDQSLGWKVLFQPASKSKSGSSSLTNKKGFSSNTLLPDLKKGDVLHCVEGRLDEKETTPPAYFTDASLLAAMTGISRFVANSELRKTLKETDGLGTEATRAGIIELLFKRQFIKREGRAIRATQSGRALIFGLPERVTLPDLTAHWERQLDTIKHKELTYEAFMTPLTRQIGELIDESDQCLFTLPKKSMPKRARKVSPKSKSRAPKVKSRKNG